MTLFCQSKQHLLEILRCVCRRIGRCAPADKVLQAIGMSDRGDFGSPCSITWAWMRSSAAPNRAARWACNVASTSAGSVWGSSAKGLPLRVTTISSPASIRSKILPESARNPRTVTYFTLHLGLQILGQLQAMSRVEGWPSPGLATLPHRDEAYGSAALKPSASQSPPASLR